MICCADNPKIARLSEKVLILQKLNMWYLYSHTTSVEDIRKATGRKMFIEKDKLVWV
jgi:hypothetical protein